MKSNFRFLHRNYNVEAHYKQTKQKRILGVHFVRGKTNNIECYPRELLVRIQKNFCWISQRNRCRLCYGCLCASFTYASEWINAFLYACTTLKSEEMQYRVHEEDGTIITAAVVMQQQESRAVSDPKAAIFSLFFIQVYMCTHMCVCALRPFGCVFYVLSVIGATEYSESACGMGSIYYVHFGVYTCTHALFLVTYTATDTFIKMHRTTTTYDTTLCLVDNSVLFRLA